MFDIGFSEITLIAVVALIVLGPERLPKVARTLGALVRRARTSWQGVKSEIERELQAEDLKRSLTESRRAVDIRGELDSLKSDITASVPMTPLAPKHAETALPVAPAAAAQALEPPIDGARATGPAAPRTDRD